MPAVAYLQLRAVGATFLCGDVVPVTFRYVALWSLTFLGFRSLLSHSGRRSLAAKNEVRTSTLPELDQSHRIPLHHFRDAQLRCVAFTVAVAINCDRCYRQFADQTSDRGQDELRYSTVSFDTHPT
jgi:hypothetical protein